MQIHRNLNDTFSIFSFQTNDNEWTTITMLCSLSYLLCFVTLDSSCREHYGLEDVCWKTGERYAFHCLIHQSSKNTYYSVQKKGQTQTDIIWHDNKILIENGEDKYTVETTRVNASYRCISLFISVDESDSGSYYRCGADGQDYQKHAQLFLASK